MKRNALCCAFAAVTFSGTLAQDGEPQSSPKFGVAATLLVTPTLDAPLDASRTTVWCSTFQLAWNELRDNVVKEDVRLTDGPAYVPSLNAGRTGREDITAGSFVIGSGFGRDGIVETLRRSLKEHFGAEAPQLNITLGSGDLLVYAALQRHLPFAVPFDRLQQPLAFHLGEKLMNVSAFGISDGTKKKEAFMKLEEQVDVLHYAGERDVVIRLKPSEAGEEIVLARIPPADSLAATLQAVRERLGPPSPRPKGTSRSPGIRLDDELRIPVISLDVEAVFRELIGKTIENAALAKLHIFDARQHIAFQLDEKGADVRSEARVGFKGEKHEGRRLVFDGPFLLYLKRMDREQPYLVAWIGDGSALKTP